MHWYVYFYAAGDGRCVWCSPKENKELFAAQALGADGDEVLDAFTRDFQRRMRAVGGEVAVQMAVTVASSQP